MKKRIKEVIIAFLIAMIPVGIILLCIYFDAVSQQPVPGPYEPNKTFSVPYDTSLYKDWVDNFDTSYTDSWGILHVTHK